MTFKMLSWMLEMAMKLAHGLLHVRDTKGHIQGHDLWLEGESCYQRMLTLIAHSQKT